MYVYQCQLELGRSITDINQRFIVWKLNNTNVDWKNTATVLNCVSARWQDEEDKTDRRFRYFGLARASQVTAKATILYGT